MKAPKIIIVLSILAITLLGSNVTLMAQHERPMQRFKEEKIKFFNENLKLSEAEAKEFWPVYEDLHNRTMKINDDERILLSYYYDNAEAMSDKEVDETIEKFQGLQQKRNELHNQYHKKFVNIIGKRKTMQMYAIEREFRVYILNKFKEGRGPGQGGGRNRDREAPPQPN